MKTRLRVLAALGLGLYLGLLTFSARAEAPSAALLPWYTNDPAIAGFAYDRLAGCLSERGVFALKPRSEVQAAVDALNIDLERTFGLPDDEFKALGQRLGTRYVLGGAFSILKELTFSGWRKDVSANLRLHQSSDGGEVGFYQTTTGFSWVSNKTALDPEAMAARAVDDFCASIANEAAAGFKPEPDPATDDGMPSY
ncbi:MAG: hypothetical protein ACPGU7_05760 [Gammaproteobacteria bacterium]